MKKLSLKTIGIIVTIVVIAFAALYFSFNFLSPIASNHSVKTFLHSNAVDLVYYEVTEFEYDHKVALDFLNLPVGTIRAELEGTADFIVPMDGISVENVDGRIIVELDKFVYKSFEISDHDYSERTMVKVNVNVDNWAEGNETMKRELNHYMQTTYTKDNGERIKANIANKIQYQLNAKFPQYDIEVRWKA